MKFLKNLCMCIILCTNNYQIIKASGSKPLVTEHFTREKTGKDPFVQRDLLLQNRSSQATPPEAVKASNPLFSRTNSNASIDSTLSTQTSSSSGSILEADHNYAWFNPTQNNFADSSPISSRQNSFNLSRSSSGSILEADNAFLPISINHTLQNRSSQATPPEALKTSSPLRSRTNSNASIESTLSTQTSSSSGSILEADHNYAWFNPIQNNFADSSPISSRQNSIKRDTTSLSLPNPQPEKKTPLVPSAPEKIIQRKTGLPEELKDTNPDMKSAQQLQGLTLFTPIQGTDTNGTFIAVLNLNGTITKTYQSNDKGHVRRIVISSDGTKSTEFWTGKNYQQITNRNENQQPTSVKVKTTNYTEHGSYENNEYLYKRKNKSNNEILIGREVRNFGEPKDTVVKQTDPIYEKMINFTTKQEVTSFIDGLLQATGLMSTKEFIKAKMDFLRNWRPNLSWSDFAKLWRPVEESLEQNTLQNLTENTPILDINTTPAPEEIAKDKVTIKK